ncbi:tricarballylate utilization 4Fe-4S protein TcuB [Thermodesulfobacteriota bacterium]
MPSTELLKEADRVMVVCNACRYCEGYCAVFPAMELRRTFTQADLKYFANLCHNCRGCYYACQYAPPHDFDLNVPKALGRLRLATYQHAAWPKAFAGLFQKNGPATGLISALSLAAVLLLLFLFQDASVILSPHSQTGAFYKVIPYLAIVLPFSALGIYIVAVLLIGVFRYIREMGVSIGEFLTPGAHIRAISDVLKLRYLDGGGYGCNYPDDRFSFIRRKFHHMVFYGFAACFASTAVAAIYDHFILLPAPYPFFSLPVLLGTIGGVSLLIGTCGLMVLKVKMDKAPAVAEAVGMDVGLLVLLFLTALSGLLLLIFRETGAMGFLLAIHLGIVGGLFLTMPYGKFVHGVYRYAALVKNAIEQAKDEG